MAFELFCKLQFNIIMTQLYNPLDWVLWMWVKYRRDVDVGRQWCWFRDLSRPSSEKLQHREKLLMKFSLKTLQTYQQPPIHSELVGFRLTREPVVIHCPSPWMRFPCRLLLCTPEKSDLSSASAKVFSLCKRKINYSGVKKHSVFDALVNYMIHYWTQMSRPAWQSHLLSFFRQMD